MKVLHIINIMATGGAEKLIVDILPRLNDRGIEADLLLFDGKDTIFLQMLRDYNCNIESLGYNINLYNPLISFKLIKYIKKYDIVHTHLFQPQYWTAFAKLISSAKVKMVTSEHNTDNRRRANKFFQKVDKFIYSQYDRVISVSDITETLLKKYLSSTDKNKFIVIPNGIDVQAQQYALPIPRKTLLGIEDVESLKLVIMVARFNPQKDQKTLIRALQLLSNDVHAVFVGEGETMEECKSLASNLNLLSRVHFLGRRKDVPNILKTADVVVMSSNYEGLSLFSLEGMASGKPFIASKAPGLTEVVEGAGELFEIGDYKSLANYIHRTLVDSIYKQNIVSKCLQRAKEYDLSIMIDKYIGVYQSVLRDE